MKHLKPLNFLLTGTLTDVHQTGYTEDFVPFYNARIFCVQNPQYLGLEMLSIQSLFELKEHVVSDYHYLYAIDTYMGIKALILTAQQSGSKAIAQ